MKEIREKLKTILITICPFVSHKKNYELNKTNIKKREENLIINLINYSTKNY